MGKLDWYILKKLFVTFFFCMMLFMVVAVAVDTSEKTDDFVRTGLGTWEIIRQYYFGFIPMIWGMLFPLFIFIAVIFFTSKMAARSEIIAILASGTSFNRMLRPYFIGGLVLSSVLWLAARYVIPKANDIQSTFRTNYMDKNDPTKNVQNNDCYNCFYRRIDSVTYMGVKNYDTASKAANRFFMQRLQDDKVVYNLRASSMRWQPEEKKWLLQNVVERTINGLQEDVTTHDTLLIDIKIKPEELRKDAYVKDKLTTPELVRFINQEKERGTEGLSALEVEKHRRTATSATVLLLTFIGAVIASRKTRGGSGMHLALGIIIAALFIVSDRFSTVFATNSNFPPVLAAWLPNIVFSVVAYFLYRRAPK